MVSRVFSLHFADCPSTAMRKLWLRLSTVRVISESSEITIGLMFRLCGATGVRHRMPVCGTMIGPPFDSE